MDAEGQFWTDGHEDEPVAGRLRFDADEGVVISLIGSLRHRSATGADTEGVRILGIAGKKLLTICECIRRSHTFEMPGGQSEIWTSSLMLAGAHWTEGEMPTFDEASVDLDQLPTWAMRSGLSFEMISEDEEFSTVSRVVATLEILEPEWFEADGTAVGLTFQSAFSGDRLVETKLTHRVSVNTRYKHARSLDEILADTNSVQDLVTLTSDAPASIVKLSVTSPDLAMERITVKGRPARRWVEIYQRQAISRAEQPQASDNLLFSFDQIGGLATVARWLDLGRRMRPVLGALLSIRYASRMYEENRYQNVLSAAESLHRLRYPNIIDDVGTFNSKRRTIIRATAPEYRSWLGQQLQFSNEPRLKHRLRDLAADAGPGFQAVVGDLDNWCEVVAGVRNRLVHSNEEEGIAVEAGDIYYLTDSVYLLVALVLLRSCGVDDSTLASSAENRRIAFLAGLLPHVVDRLFAQLYPYRAADAAAESPSLGAERSGVAEGATVETSTPTQDVAPPPLDPDL